MHSYLAILEEGKVSKRTLMKYFEGKNIKLEKFYTSIGVVKFISSKILIISDLKYITNLKLGAKEYKIVKEK